MGGDGGLGHTVCLRKCLGSVFLISWGMLCGRGGCSEDDSCANGHQGMGRKRLAHKEGRRQLSLALDNGHQQPLDLKGVTPRGLPLSFQLPHTPVLGGLRPIPLGYCEPLGH